MTPDYNPIISPSPVDGLWLLAGFSGHGYKISPAVGELMADLVVHGASRYPGVDHRDFRWERFADGRPADRAPIPTSARARCAERAAAPPPRANDLGVLRCGA